jgi:hypothetical protein
MAEPTIPALACTTDTKGWKTKNIFGQNNLSSVPILLLPVRYYIMQDCGSGLIQYGSGSSIFAQSGSGSSSGSKLKQNFWRQFFSQIFLKSKFESNQFKNTGVFHQIFFQKVVGAILYLCLKNTKKCIFLLKFLNFLAPGSGSGIRIPNTDPDPQSHWIRIRIHNPDIMQSPFSLTSPWAWPAAPCTWSHPSPADKVTAFAYLNSPNLDIFLTFNFRMDSFPI